MVRADARTTRNGGSGFTLIEMLVVVLIVFVVIATLSVALARALGGARATGERQLLVSTKLAIEQFEKEFGFLPPLVDNDKPLVGGSLQPMLSDADLDDPASDPPRYSVYSLAFYLTGSLDKTTPDGVPVDGVAGPSMSRVDSSGAFVRRGRPVGAFLTGERIDGRIVKSGALRPDAVPVPITTDLPVLVDRWNGAVLYFRWEPEFNDEGLVDDEDNDGDAYNVPEFFGDAVEDVALRGARYGLLSAGPDGMIDFAGGPDAPANRDNIVEVGP